ncbi:hypothetical protein LMH87_009559 [Akanthomyces muscarius]|uniref:Uncharacterized protein n=1 Tax=Akanthomyces muscarius TaxID=2231603 RepID=A0A9W8QE60_AKAMU|nr:hypothetical protein LMH87_009559 [Akanthomyces muscarius]KAJ4153051.1 hypothetical protein LMH87_009559 [Akanthomyces muscarius]
MEHSIALVTGATSGLGHAAASALAADGWRGVIVTGRSLARVKETAVQLAEETKRQVFTPLELDLDKPSSVQAALAELVKRDVAAFAAKHHQGDRTAAVEALLRNGPNVKYEPNRAYTDAKLIIAWWAAALARRLPPSMAVYAVSPGSAPDTQVTPETAARRYLQASEFGTDVSGQFFASPPKKVTGAIEAMRHQHFHDRASQEAAWQAVVKVSGVDLPDGQRPQQNTNTQDTQTASTKYA